MQISYEMVSNALVCQFPLNVSMRHLEASFSLVFYKNKQTNKQTNQDLETFLALQEVETARCT